MRCLIDLPGGVPKCLNWASSVTHDGTGYCGVGGGEIGWGSAWADPAPTRAKAIAAPATVIGTVFLVVLLIPLHGIGRGTSPRSVLLARIEAGDDGPDPVSQGH